MKNIFNNKNKLDETKYIKYNFIIISLFSVYVIHSICIGLLPIQTVCYYAIILKGINANAELIFGNCMCV